MDNPSLDELRQAVDRLCALQLLIDLFITCRPYSVTLGRSDTDEPGLLAGAMDDYESDAGEWWWQEMRKN